LQTAQHKFITQAVAEVHTEEIQAKVAAVTEVQTQVKMLEQQTEAVAEVPDILVVQVQAALVVLE
tara:strand:- start:31 stop:225 length:195 start_codon:yes stop_codon:yes gene_type:complete